jgi:hypothetical protein
MQVPERDPERPQDDPWDANAVRWLLGQPGGGAWTRGKLMQCLRKQPAQGARTPADVQHAADFADRHGVKRVAEEYGTQFVVRLYRTDAGAPSYPRTPQERRELLRG